MLKTKMLSDLLISSRDSLTNKQIDTLRKVAVKGDKFSITIEDVPYKDLAIDKFQRDIKVARIIDKDIKNVGCWDARLQGLAITWKKPDGKYSILDGQHKSLTALLIADAQGTLTDDSTIKSMVIECEHREEAARLFDFMNGGVGKQVSNEENFRALFTAGVREYVELGELLVDANLSCGGINPDGKFAVSITQLRKCVELYDFFSRKYKKNLPANYKNKSRDIVVRVSNFLQQTWPTKWANVLFMSMCYLLNHPSYASTLEDGTKEWDMFSNWIAAHTVKTGTTQGMDSPNKFIAQKLKTYGLGKLEVGYSYGMLQQYLQFADRPFKIDAMAKEYKGEKASKQAKLDLAA
jgi:hypothetical protein